MSEPEDLLSSLQRRVRRSLEQQRRAERELHAGSYDPCLGLMLLDPTLSPVDRLVVLLHEHAHFVQGQTHWGEAIRRLDHLQVQIAVPLQFRRSQIIYSVVRDAIGREPTEQDLAGIPTSIEWQRGIRSMLAADDVFMRGLKTIDDAEKRKRILSQQWIRTQEGFAYWAGFHLGRDMFEKTDRRDGLRRIEEMVAAAERTLPAAEAEG